MLDCVIGRPVLRMPLFEETWKTCGHVRTRAPEILMEVDNDLLHDHAPQQKTGDVVPLP